MIEVCGHRLLLGFSPCCRQVIPEGKSGKILYNKISKDNFLVTKLPLGTKVAAKLSLAGQGVRQPGLAARL
jgi:hypothetical protein